MATRTKRIQTDEYNLTAEDVQFECPDGMNANLTEFRELENAILLGVELDGKTYCGWLLKATDGFAPVKVEKRKKRSLKINKLPSTLNDADGQNTPKKQNVYDRENWPKGYVDIRNTVEGKLRFGRDKKISFCQGSDSQGKEKPSSHFKECGDSTKSDSQNESNYIERKKIFNDNSPIDQFKKRGRPPKIKRENYKDEYLDSKGSSEENFQSSFSGFGIESLEYSSSNDSASLSVRLEGKKTLDDSFSYSPERILNYSLEENKLPSVINKLQTESEALSKSIQVSTEDDLT